MAKLVTSQTTGGIPTLLSRFADFIGPSDLNKLLKRVRTKLGVRTVLSPAALDRYAIPLGLSRFYGRTISSPRNLALTASPNLYKAVSFAAGVLECSRHLSEAGKKILRGKTLTALAPGRDARPLAHEFRVAFTLAHQEWDIEFTDFESRGQFDFIARQGDKEIEVECKCITGDCGDAIHREEFDLLKSIRKVKLLDVASRIDVAFSNRMPKTAAEKKALIEGITALLDGKISRVAVGEATVSIERVDQWPSDPNDLQASGYRALDSIREERNGSVFGIFDKDQFLAVHVFSERESKVQGSIRETIELASPQLSKTRPGIIWTHFADLTNAELDALIEIYRDGTFTLIEGIAYKMFNSSKHEHVAALLFSSEAPVQKRGGSGSLIIHTPYHSQRGTIYPLWNKNCTLNKPFRELLC